MEIEQLLSMVYEIFTVFGVKIVGAIAVFIVGRWVAKFLANLIRKLMDKRELEPTITKFVGNLIYFALVTFVVLAALGLVGIQTTSFIAVIGAAGLAIGLALQGSLANFAAGFLLILFRPFKVGDFIDAAGVAGTVESIQIFTTQLATPDNKTIIIPNSKLTGDNIINFSAKGTRRADMVFGIGYEDDIDKARDIFLDLVRKNSPDIIKDLLNAADKWLNGCQQADDITFLLVKIKEEAK